MLRPSKLVEKLEDLIEKKCGAWYERHKAKFPFYKLIHATDPVIIQKFLDKLKHCKLNMAKVNKFRLLAGNCKIEYR